jgi:hypothetical protein
MTRRHPFPSQREQRLVIGTDNHLSSGNRIPFAAELEYQHPGPLVDVLWPQSDQTYLLIT